MKKITLLILVLVVGFTGRVLAQDPLETACYEKGGSWNSTDQLCTMTTGIEVNIQYPLEVADYPTLAQAVDEFITSYRQQFLSNWTPDDITVSLGMMWSLDMQYTVYQNAENLIGVNFGVGEFAGGAHPNYFYHSLVLDVANDRLLTINDLFTDPEAAFAVIVPAVQAQVTEKIGAESLDPQWLTDGTDPAVEGNYANFAVSEDALLIFIPPYQVGPYAIGSFTISVPLVDLQGTLADFVTVP